MSTYKINTSNSLTHYGIMGMHWGVRRYQNPDGSLTSEGKAHYSVKTSSNQNGSSFDKEKAKKVAKVGASVVGTALVAYGTYKLASTGQLNKAVKVGKSVVNRAMESAKQSAKTVPNKLKNETKDWTNIAKEAGKQVYAGFKEGVPEGAKGAGKTLGKVMVGGVTWMAGIEVADLMTDGAATQRILKAYNDYNKKDNKVRTTYRGKEDED